MRTQKFLGSDIFGAYKDEARIAALAAEGRDFPEMMFHDTILAEGAQPEPAPHQTCVQTSA